MSGKPIVPSKDALRALRSLAYSSPATLLGTVAALCGVVTVHHQEQRQLQKVQQILDTKRKLHSISQGRGPARVALMFEAAERGEDFTIQGNKSRRSMKTRKLHLQSVQSESGAGEGSVAQSLEQHHNTSPTTPTTEWTPIQLMDPGSLARASKTYKLKLQPKEAGAAKVEAEWNEVTRRAREHRKRTVQRTTTSLRPPQEQEPRRSTPSTNSLIDQPVSDLHPIKTDAVSESVSSPTQETRRDPVDVKLEISLLDLKNAFSMLRPWQSDATDPTSQAHEALSIDRASLDKSDQHIYITSSGQVPAFEIEHSTRSRYNFDSEKIKKGMAVVGVERYEYVYNTLMNLRQKQGNDAALDLLYSIMKQYTATDKRSDFALVQAIFLDCTWVFPTSNLKPFIHRYVEHFLRGDMPRLEVVSLLYPNCGASAQTYEQHYYFPAHQYLEYIRDKGYNLDQQVIELRKVLAGTKMCNLPPHEHLVIPILRSFCTARQMAKAHALLDEMAQTYKIEVSFYSLQEIIKGYARAGSWAKIKAILDECHAKELSRQKVYGVGGLVAAIIDEYAVSHAPETVVRFVMESLHDYDVQPVSSMTREMVSLCLRERRYDLVLNWIEMVRTDYPHIDTGTGSSTFAFDVSCAWRDMDASCEDILYGCRAIAGKALRDPFSNTFRSTISEAVTRCLQPQLKPLREVFAVDVPADLITNAETFHAFLVQLKAQSVARGMIPREELVLTYLLRQVEALRSLNALCGGQWRFQEDSVPASSSKSENDGKMPRMRSLPAMSSLESLLRKKYVHGDMTGQPVDHTQLRETVTQLVRLGRESHAFDLIEIIHSSRWAQPPTGREFDLDLFTEWLRLASRLKSGSKVRAVLWAIAEAGPKLELSSQLILLARVAAPKTHLAKVKSARTFEVDEVEYLRLRLKRRHWSSMRSHHGVEIESWRGMGEYRQ